MEIARKRKAGRPKGSLNKATLRAQVVEAVVEEVVEEAVEEEAVEEEEVEEEEEVAPPPSKPDQFLLDFGDVGTIFGVFCVVFEPF